jgi:diadenosine tetraphosphatase ApaH/serine/threonine PP2A family protein phosphatase
MKIALLADLHANLEATLACLAHAAAAGVDRHAFLGDVVGYNADPGPVVEIVAAHAARGAIVVRGNHDEAVASGDTATMDPAAARAAAWTRARLTEGQRRFLGALPLLVRSDGATFVHGSADAPEEWAYVTDAFLAARSIVAAATPWVFSGHVHAQALYHLAASGRARAFQPVPGVPVPVARRRHWLALVGSVGQPRDGSSAASYAVVDLEAEVATFFRVPYDAATAADKVRAAGLPETLARRLLHGG